MTPGLVISIVGAESTGKSTLAAELALALAQQGLRCAQVDETLREFCDQTGRTPTREEQAGIAAAQTQRITAAASGHDVVIADTTALMTAVYSDFVFGDTSLYASALATQRGYALTLLTALDLPWQADGLQRDGAHVRVPVDGLIRRALLSAQLGWSVIAGTGPARLDNALAAARRAVPALARQTLTATPCAEPNVQGGIGPLDPLGPCGWRHLCTRCSDGDCERRLFALARRGSDDSAAAC
jgi:nicotinamide riboside kinase